MGSRAPFKGRVNTELGGVECANDEAFVKTFHAESGNAPPPLLENFCYC